MKITLSNGTTLEGSEGEILSTLGKDAFEAVKAGARAAALQPAPAAPAAQAQMLPAPGAVPTEMIAVITPLIAAAVRAAREDDRAEERQSWRPTRASGNGVRLSNPDRVKAGTCLVPVAGTDGAFATFSDAHAELSPIESVGVVGAAVTAVGVMLAAHLFGGDKQS